MSKAFDTVTRAELLEELEKILDRDELHIIYLLIGSMKLQVKYETNAGRLFDTNVGVPQGDSLSPTLFTLYLAFALQYTETTASPPQDHDYVQRDKPISKPYTNIIPQHLTDHTYTNFDLGVTIDLQYADDTGWVSTDSNATNYIKNTLPAKLKKANLNINEDKTEEYEVTRKGSEEWKKCKYLGSLLDTEEDIKRRKCLAMDAFSHYTHSLTSNKIDLKTRMRLFNAYITSIFLYNSELWTLTKKLENTVDVFQRRLYRKILKIRWPHVIRNTDLYERVEEKPWSDKIRTRRLLWMGHIQRLPADTPARLAVAERLRPARRPQGGQKSYWVSLVNKDLSSMHLSPFGSTASFSESGNRKIWRSRILNEQA